MRPRDLGEVARAIGGELVGDGSRDRTVAGASIDTRTLVPGDLFFALPGRHGHGIEFVDEVAARGGVAVVCARDVVVPPQGFRGPWIRVRDPVVALAGLAHYDRAFPADRVPAAAITGSVGKTTVCGYSAQLLDRAGLRAHRPRGSHNNHLGVPLTILNTPGPSDALITEVGTNAPGEVLALGRIVRPEVAVVTAIKPAHLLGLGTLELVAREKLSLLESVEPGGEMWVPQEWREAARELGFRRSRIAPVTLRSFAVGPGVSDADLEVWAEGREIVVRSVREPELRRFEWAAPFPHSLHNLAAALAVVTSFGVRLGALGGSLSGLELPPLRGDVESHAGVELLLDCYNSNPAALESAIEKLESEPVRGRRVAVIGTMEELGPDEVSWHRRMGGRLASGSIDTIYLVGRGGEWLRAGLRDAGADGEPLTTDESAARHLAGTLRRGDRVLFKASRRERLEQFARQVGGYLDAGESMS